MTVKEFKDYLNNYKEEQEVIFKLPSGQNWEVDTKLMAGHNIRESRNRKDCKIYLK